MNTQSKTMLKNVTLPCYHKKKVNFILYDDKNQHNTKVRTFNR